MTTTSNASVARRKLGALVLLAGSSIAAGTLGVPWAETDDRRMAPALTLLRVTAVIGGSYLVLAIVLGLLSARDPQRRRLGSFAEAVSPTVIRRLVDLALATGLTMAVVVPATSARVTGVPRPTLAGRPAVVGDPASGQRWPVLPDPVTTTPAPVTTAAPVTTTPTPSTAMATSSGPTTPPHARSLVVLRHYGPAIPAPVVAIPTPALAVSASPVASDATRTVSSAPAAPAATHIVRRGESFWSIAEAQVHSHATTADDSRVAEYWRQLVDANTDRLPVPGHPDLLYAGVRLELPAVAS